MPIGETFNLNPDYHRMSDFLGVNVYDRNDHELAKKVDFIKEWASKKTGKKDLTNVLWEVRNLQKSLGHNFIGKPLIVEMYKNLRLDQDRQLQREKPKDVLMREQPKIVKETKSSPIQKVVADTVQQSISGMVQKALSDPKLIQGTIQNAVKEALK